MYQCSLGTVGTAASDRAAGSQPRSTDGSRGAVAYGVPFQRRKYAARKFGSLAVYPPDKPLAQVYRAPASILMPLQAERL